MQSEKIKLQESCCSDESRDPPDLEVLGGGHSGADPRVEMRWIGDGRPKEVVRRLWGGGGGGDAGLEKTTVPVLSRSCLFSPARRDSVSAAAAACNFESAGIYRRL
jgi:hypothetical protein